MSKKLKQLLSILLSAFILAGATLPASAATVNDFTDVNTGAWYYRAVEYAAAEGLFAGTDAHTFSPNMGMTRGMFVTVLGRKNGVDKADYPTSRFTDVKPGDWFGPYVEWAAENGIVHGVGDGKFDPNRKISREQMAKILYGYAQLTGSDTTVNESRYTQFPDTGRVSAYAGQSMKWAVSHGILKGTDGKLDPQGTATRAQVAQVFLNAKDVLTEKRIAEKPEEKPAQTLDLPQITLTPGQQAALGTEQDPQEVVRMVSQSTAAIWDASLTADKAYALDVMPFGQTSDGMYTTSHAAFNATAYLENTGADRYCLKVYEDYSYLVNGKPATGMELLFTIPTKADSSLIAEARGIIETQYPNARFTPDAIKTGNGWRGYLTTADPQEVARQEIHYLSEWHGTADSFDYWLSEPSSGKVWFYY